MAHGQTTDVLVEFRQGLLNRHDGIEVKRGRLADDPGANQRAPEIQHGGRMREFESHSIGDEEGIKEFASEKSKADLCPV